MAAIKGGAVVTDGAVELSISVAGGKPYKRIFVDVVATAINKFVIITSTLRRVLSDSMTDQDMRFYLAQIQELMYRAHVEIIPGHMPFQIKYNAWLLDGYVRLLLETQDIKLIAQLLCIDSMLYSIEDAGFSNDIPALLEFDVPKTISIKKISNQTVAYPENDSTEKYLHSLNKNIKSLADFIQLNKPAFDAIHDSIVKTAAEFLK